MAEDKFTVEEALDELVSGITETTTAKVGGLWDFVRDVWSQGFERPELFDAWHVGVICEDVERSLEEGKHYVAVLPRYHFKSTILGHATSIWLLLRNPRDTNVLYLSYSDGMAQYHISEINKIVRRVPQLKDWLKDRSPKADFSFRYKKGHNNVEILHGGLFSFKRGLHVNGGMIADDILRDPENPLNLTQLSKIDDHFMTESMFIPNQNAPVIVLGTPMMPEDLLFQLQKDERFNSRVLPALNPTPDRKVLFPAMFSFEWLKTQENARPKSFASEFMLQPHLSTVSYFSDKDIKSVEDDSLLNRNPRQKFEFDSELTVAGFDVGKKRHPSHLAVYTSKNGKIEQICNYFLDNWEYTDQIELMNQAVENFGIDYGYFDNTRGELEERGLDEAWSPLHFGRKIKFTMAQVMEEYINSKKMLMIVDFRQRSQITCVDGNLKAPETPMGHGDAFFSNAMAVMAHFELTTSDTETIGDMQDMTSLSDIDAPKDDVARVIEKVTAFEDLTSFTIGACPECKETAGWVHESNLCLICNKKF